MNQNGRQLEIDKIAKLDLELAAELKSLFDADQSAEEESFLAESEFQGSETLAFNNNNFEHAFPKKLGQYELREKLGSGGMGIVFRAVDTIAQREVALKLVKPDLQHDKELQMRMVNEAHAAAKLSHSNIVPVFDVGTADDIFYFTMPLLKSGDLKSSTAVGNSVETADLFKQLAEGLLHAHQHGVIHRDIKPSNIMMDATGSPLLADFGLAKDLNKKGFQTETGRLMGSANYMSPEQIEDSKNVTELSDIYSFGATLYEFLNGKPPFSSSDIIDLFQQIKNLKPAKPSDMNSEVDPKLEAICLKCLEKTPQNRFASMEEVIAELQRVIDGKPLSGKSNVWHAVSNVFGFQQSPKAEFISLDASGWVFFHGLTFHLSVWCCIFFEMEVWALWFVIGVAVVVLAVINWYYHWSRYWHLEIMERTSGIGILMVNLSLVSLFLVHGPISMSGSVGCQNGVRDHFALRCMADPKTA
ncbi:serine/threonine protein kinase [bacterium]|nr:serine/threonine protein kinase [bacterium]